MNKIFLSILIWVVGSILTIALYFAMLLCTFLLYPFDKKRALTHMQCFWWSDAAITLNPYWKIEVSGLNNIDKKRTYIIIANHQSLADIVLAYQIKGNFSNGAFKLAIKEHVPILPILFEGTGTAIPKGSWIFSTKTFVKLKILPAIETINYRPSDFANVRDLAQSVLEKNSLSALKP